MAHSHLHDHPQPTKEVNYNKAFAIGIALNSLYIIVEFIYGLLVDSMALIADAGHNLSDVLGLALAWGATILAKKAITKNRTYGYRKSTILAALFNALILLIAIGAIAYESVSRIFTPAPVAGNIIMIVAGIGVVINAVTAFFFISGRKTDLNIKGAFLHMAADAVISAGVVIGGLIINIYAYYIIDPILSLVIVTIIFIGTWGLLKDSFNMAMDAVPEGIDVNEVSRFILNLPEIEGIHDLHIWPLSTTETALSVHVIKSNPDTNNSFLENLEKEMSEKFGINHCTVQIEEKGFYDKNHSYCDK